MVRQKVGTTLLLIIATTCATHAFTKQNPVQNATKCSKFEKDEGIENFRCLAREIEKDMIEEKLKVGEHKIYTLGTAKYECDCINIIERRDPYVNKDGHISYYKLKSNGKTYLMKRSHHFFGFTSDVGVYNNKIKHKSIAEIRDVCHMANRRTQEVDDKEFEKRNKHRRKRRRLNTLFDNEDNQKQRNLTEVEEIDEINKLADREKIARSKAIAYPDKTAEIYEWYRQKHGYDVYYALIEYLPLCFVDISDTEWINDGTDVIEEEYKHDRSIEAILKMGLDIAQAIKHLNNKGYLHLDVCLDNIRGCTNEDGDWGFKLFSHNYIAKMMPHGRPPTEFFLLGYIAPEALIKGHTRRHVDVYCLGKALYYCQEKYKEMCKNKSKKERVFQDQRKLKILQTVVSKIDSENIKERPRINTVIDILQMALEKLKKIQKGIK